MSSSPCYVPTSDSGEVELEPPRLDGEWTISNSNIGNQQYRFDSAQIPQSRHSTPFHPYGGLYRQRSRSITPRPVEESFVGQLYTPFNSYPTFIYGSLSQRQLSLESLAPTAFTTASTIGSFDLDLPFPPPTVTQSRALSVISGSQTELESVPPFLNAEEITAGLSRAPSVVSESQTEPESVLLFPYAEEITTAHSRAPSVTSESQTEPESISLFPNTGEITTPPSRAPSVVSESQTEPESLPLSLTAEAATAVLSSPPSELALNDHLFVQHISIEIEALEDTIKALSTKHRRLIALRASVSEKTLA
ncbi:hypothetical protein H1R20_g10868, partial [Candolleomyces eurysporus]